MLAFRFVCAILFAAVALIGTTGAARTQSDDELKALNQRAIALYNVGKFAEAVPLQERYAHLIRERLGPEHARFAQALDELSVLYNRAGRSVDAEPVAKQSLAIREKIFGPTHPSIADSLMSLGEIEGTLGRKGDQEARIRRALSIREISLGREHSLVADALASLALACDRPECGAETEWAMKRVIAIREKTLGPENRITLYSRFVLAAHYWSAGRLSEAEPLYRQGIRNWERLFPADQSELSYWLHALAEIARAQGRFEEARGLHLRSLAIRDKILPADSQVLVGTIRALAVMADAEGRYADAAKAYERLVKIAADDANMARTFEGLANSYYGLGRYRDAEPVYKRALEMTEKAHGPDHPHVAGILNNLANLYEAQGRYFDVEPLHKRALAIKEKHLGPDHEDVAASLHNLADLYQNLGRYQEAQQLEKRALDIKEKTLGPNHGTFGQSLMVLAHIYGSLGRYEDAEPLIRRAVAIYEKAGAQYQRSLAGAFQALAELRQIQDKQDEAEDLLRRAIGIEKTALEPDHPNLVNTYNALANLLDEQGRGGEAKEYLERALEIAEKSLGREHPEALWSRVSLALREAEKNPQMEIGPIVERARALAETKMGSTHPQLIQAFTRVGRTYMIRQDWLTAYRYLKRGSEIAEQKERYFHEGKRPSWNEFTAPHASAIRAAFRIAKSSQPPGLPDEVFRLSQFALQTAAAKALGQMAARFCSGSGPLAKLVRERQDLLGQRTAAQRRFFLQKTGAVASQNAGSELSAIEARLTAVDEQLRREFPEYANLANPEPLTIAEVQAQLRSDEVLVQFVEAPKVATLPSEIFVWAIDKQRSRWASVELDGQAVDRLARALRCGLDDGQWIASAQNPDGPSQCRQLLDHNSQAIGRHPLPFDLKKSHLLYRALLGPVEDLVKGKHILVVPSGVLGSLPFHVLVTEAPDESAEGSDAFRKARWLIARQAITVLPSVASLKALRRTGGTGQASRAYAAFGNPLLDGDATTLGHVERAAAARERQGCPASPTPVRLAAKETRLALKPLARGGVADVMAIRRLLPLPETSDELCTVAAKLGAQPTEVRLGALATETGIKALSANGQLGEYRIVHFATHGALSGEIDGNAEPGLILTPPKIASELDDGYLTASEIAALKLDADWVILSACNTAAAGPADAESLSGLARAFFYAGARSLLVSHWAVDSDATVELITKAFGAMRAEPRIGRAEALRRSMLALIESGGRLSHPAIWAPFVVVGEGGVTVSSPAVKAAPKGTTGTKVQRSVPRGDWQTEVFGR